MINIGITGTRIGATREQIDIMVRLANDYTIHELHHGDCVGVDEQAHDFIGSRSEIIIIHPPTDPKYRAWCEGDVLLAPRSYLVRNRAIVNATDMLFGFPDGPERLRSGTWSTVRYAVEQNKPVTIIYPDGRTEQRSNT